MQIEEIRFKQAQEAQAKRSGVRTDIPEEGREAGSESAIVQFGSVNVSKTSPFYQKNEIEENSLVDEIADDAMRYSNAQIMKRELSMSAAGFSTDDLNEAKKEGYDLKNMDGREIITVTDQIKMQLLKAGKDISNMGGLSAAEIEAMSGNAAIAAAMEQALKEADLPTDADIVEDAVTAVQKAGELTQPTMQTIKNLLLSEEAPTIENVYRATFSQGAGGEKPSIADAADGALDEQLAAVIEKAGLTADDKQMENARWMLGEDIPVTPENVRYLNTLQSEGLRLNADDIRQAILTAVSEGDMPQDAYIMRGYSMHDQAESAWEIVEGATEQQVAAIMKEELPLTIEQLAAKQEQGVAAGNVTSEMTPEGVRAMRLLEETRLLMTQEANLSLIRRGVAIDTTELSELVEQLKEQEQAFYKSILGENDEVALVEKIEQFETMNSTIGELAEMPAVLLGRIPDAAEAAISRLHEEGVKLQSKLALAGERYEVMRTEIRRDLGDSIRKAFQNVDDIIEDIGMEPTEENERAVRILAYNELEITQESILSMRAVDEQAQRAFKNLTPAVVAKMIREGDNPLDLSLEELNEKTEAIKAVSGTESAEEDFAKFLWKAEQSGEISEEERAGFIGICRLIYQVEKTDGAVIGQLLHQGSEVTLRNMMGAVRTRRHENREYQIDDDFGFAKFDKTVLSITDQIEMAFQTNRMRDAKEVLTPEKLGEFESEDAYLSMSPDAFAGAIEQMETSAEDEDLEKSWEKMQLREMKEAIASEQRVYDIMDRFDLPQSPANLEAFTQLLADRNGMYRKLFSSDRKVFGDEADEAENKDIRDIMEDVIKAFGEAVKTPEDMAEAQRNLEEIATNVMRNMLMEERVGTIDVRGMQLAVKQIRTVGEIGQKSETYAVPIMVADEAGNMSLKIVRGKDEDRGLVDIALQTERLGNIYASFRYEGDALSGQIRSDRVETRELLLSHQEDLAERVFAASALPVSLHYTFDGRTDANAVYDERSVDFEQEEERPEIQTRVLYGIARGVIEAFSRM